MAIDKSKPVLITGCSTGIGRATAEQLAGNGWNVYATARKPDAIEDLKAAGLQDAGARRHRRELDGQRRHARSRRPTARSGRSSTTPATARAARSRRSRWTAVRRQFETNVFGLMRMCQLVLPGMREAGEGRIVNISSMGGKLVFPGGGVYHATKHAVEALSDALRFEVAGLRRRRRDHRAGPDHDRVRRDRRSAASTPTSDDGPYAKFNAEVAQGRPPSAYKGPMASFGGGPETVADKIEKASRPPAARARATRSRSRPA